jgi:hypothetical protein
MPCLWHLAQPARGVRTMLAWHDNTSSSRPLGWYL